VTNGTIIIINGTSSSGIAGQHCVRRDSFRVKEALDMPTPMNILRTPEERFANLPDFAYPPHYTDVGGLRMAHVETGPADAPPVLMLHGEPSWSFLYRKMMPIVAAAGYRAITPDLVGCGRSDKPAAPSDYTYAHHVEWMTGWMQAPTCSTSRSSARIGAHSSACAWLPNTRSFLTGSYWRMAACRSAESMAHRRLSRPGSSFPNAVRSFLWATSSARGAKPD
jgi:hypothetical protein